ncbi:aminotransferase class V-fold PLP-dependent enzyme [Ilumatobacter sp.]|uniref:aminotransferase class V-fold PLP-dependent enzyme n=1 Tax=Ilumatobacter sp. TaxID=1967498 RepID=UPI003B523ED6
MTAPFTAEEVTAIRAATPGCDGDLIHLDHAGSSLPARAVLDTQIDHLRREAAIGGYRAAAEAAERSDAVRSSLATMLGANPSEIARTEHATAAWNAAFWSIPMRAGQRVVTHDHDYGANQIALLHAAERFGVVVERVASDGHGQIDLDRLATVLERPDDVAVVSLAWIPTSSGLVNPAAAVGSLCRSAGVPFLLDACQAVGQLDVDVAQLGCDFCSGTGRKFLRGPRGTGFLYARAGILDRVVPSQPDHHGARWLDLDRYDYVEGARRFEHWEHSVAGWLALGAAVDVALELGIDRIEATIAQRADELRARLADVGMAVHDPGAVRCGIVTATHPELAADDVSSALRDRGINTTVTFAGSALADMAARRVPPATRLSVHCTTTADELDRVVDAVRAL